MKRGEDKSEGNIKKVWRLVGGAAVLAVLLGSSDEK
jgi:hypothetical protein